MKTAYPVHVELIDPDTCKPVKMWLFTGPHAGQFSLRIGPHAATKRLYYTTPVGMRRSKPVHGWVREDGPEVEAGLFIVGAIPSIAPATQARLFTLRELGPHTNIVLANGPHAQQDGIGLHTWGPGYAITDQDGSIVYTWSPANGWIPETGPELAQPLLRLSEERTLLLGMDYARLPAGLDWQLFPHTRTSGAQVPKSQGSRALYEIQHKEFYLTAKVGPLKGRTFHFRECTNKGRGSYNAQDSQRFARVTDSVYRSGGSGAHLNTALFLTDFDGKEHLLGLDDFEITLEKPGGMKYSVGKPRFSLVPYEVLWETIAILEMGAVKYGLENWKKVADANDEYFNAMQRHLKDWRSGELRDKESGRLHMAHVICNALFLGWLGLQDEKKALESPISE